MNTSISLNDQLIEHIDLERLVIYPGNVRKSTISKEEELAPLAASIASVGLINPLTPPNRQDRSPSLARASLPRQRPVSSLAL